MDDILGNASATEHRQSTKGIQGIEGIDGMANSSSPFSSSLSLQSLVSLLSLLSSSPFFWLKGQYQSLSKLEKDAVRLITMQNYYSSYKTYRNAYYKTQGIDCIVFTRPRRPCGLLLSDWWPLMHLAVPLRSTARWRKTLRPFDRGLRSCLRHSPHPRIPPRLRRLSVGVAGKQR